MPQEADFVFPLDERLVVLRGRRVKTQPNVHEANMDVLAPQAEHDLAMAIARVEAGCICDPRRSEDVFAT